MLERVQIPYYIEQFLRSQYTTNDKRILGLHKTFSDSFDQSLALIQNHWKKINFQNLLGYRHSINDIHELAEEIALYFRQGRVFCPFSRKSLPPEFLREFESHHLLQSLLLLCFYSKKPK